MPYWYLPAVIQASADSVSSRRTMMRGRRRDFDAQITARAGVLHALVLNHAHARDHVKLLADLDADPDQGVAVVPADGRPPLGGQTPPNFHDPFQLGCPFLLQRSIRSDPAPIKKISITYHSMESDGMPPPPDHPV